MSEVSISSMNFRSMDRISISSRRVLMGISLRISLTKRRNILKSR